ncbi:hypothetical protein R1sor_019319 [Riccia sorocarpa]|uniref:Uncharacterized protein n=1 Tax=Riccia sorocarpa TaxID=122646 RepID=A0ABD3ICB6_9MARC
MDSLAPMHTKFVELANRYEETRAQYMAMQESLKAQWEEEQRLLQATREMQAMMAKVRQSDQGLVLRALHPRTFDLMKTAKKDDNYLNSMLLPVLDKLRFHREDMMSFVEANRQAAQAPEPFGKLEAYWGTMDARDETFIWSNCKASDRFMFRGRLDEHRIKQAVQTATDLVTAEENWPSQNPDEAGPSQPADSDLAELGRPLVPPPLTRYAILSKTEILLSGSRDEDEELARLHGDLD